MLRTGRTFSLSSESATADDPKQSTTIPQFLRALATAYGDDVAVTLTGDTIPDDQITFRELDLRSRELAKGLLARGVGKGSRVGFIYGNSPTFALLLMAISRIGAIAIPISTLIKANELVRVLRQSDAGGLIVQRSLLGHDYVERLVDALPALREGASRDLRLPQAPYLRWVVSTGADLPASIGDLGEIFADAGSVSEELLAQVESEVHPTDQMIEIYTSGSMALPKGVKHLHGPILYRTHYIRSMTAIERGMVSPATLPMFWVGGLMMSLMPNLEIGAVTACTEGTSTNSRMAMGSVLGEDEVKLLGQARTSWGLGMTETIGPYSYGDVIRAPGYPLCAPLDHIADRYDVRVAVDGKPVGDGEIGEVQVRGYPVTPGLHKIERSAYFTDDGFYHTGDMGLVEGTRINFVGRDGDMIKTAGSNVSPAEVELEMQQLDGVSSAYVLGLPDAQRGQVVVAAVVPEEGVTLDFDAIQAQLRNSLSSFKVPRIYLEIARGDVPMLHSNKVGRRLLEKLVSEKLGRG
jgi:acyl-CoA synthetase (AMP-forming)/AMP-acid ligase II